MYENLQLLMSKATLNGHASHSVTPGAGVAPIQLEENQIDNESLGGSNSVVSEEVQEGELLSEKEHVDEEPAGTTEMEDEGAGV